MAAVKNPAAWGGNTELARFFLSTVSIFVFFIETILSEFF